MIINLTFFVLVFLLSGCTEKAFKPVPDEYFLWTKPGMSLIDVKKSLLECGEPTPAGTGEAFSLMTDNEHAIVEVCMRRLGYTFEYGDYASICSTRPELNLPACQSGAQIPAPSVEMRLNSDYCKRKRGYQFCKDTAPNPAACERMDFNNPPAECLL